MVTEGAEIKGMRNEIPRMRIWFVSIVTRGRIGRQIVAGWEEGGIASNGVHRKTEFKKRRVLLGTGLEVRQWCRIQELPHGWAARPGVALKEKQFRVQEEDQVV